MCSVQTQTEEISKISSLTQTTNDVVTLMTSVGTNTNSNPSISGINKSKSIQSRKSLASTPLKKDEIQLKRNTS